MNKVLIIVLLLVLVTACTFQNTNSQRANRENPNKNKFAENLKPKGNWKVHKEVDECGNMIKYDSIYTYSSDRGASGFGSENIVKHYQSVTKGHHLKLDNIISNDSTGYFFGGSSLDDKVLEQFPEMAEVLKQMKLIQKQMIQDFDDKKMFLQKNRNTK